MQDLCRQAVGLLSVLSLLIPAQALFALGTEELGNKPLSPANYTDWPGLVVNGNENCFYKGSTDELNEALRTFAAAELKVHEVVLRPGPDSVKTFDQKSEFTFNWHLQIFGGIAGHMTTLDQGDQVWPKHPRLTVYVGGDIDLEKIEVPDKVKLIGLTELSARARKGIGSSDKSVRGWSAGVIASIDPFDKQNQAAVEKLLKDGDDWVRLNAAGAIALFGRQAASAVPLLKECLERGDAALKERAAATIEKIESAPDQPEKSREHREAVEWIERFIAEKRK